jgi:hypothetical protein
MTLNLHKIFFNSTDDSYLAALSLEGRTEESLRAARDVVRSTLRQALGSFAGLSRDALFEALALDSAPTSLKPKFRMQGSFSYRTCNDPAHKPPQEIDLDDGMFLPVSFLQERGGRAHPIVISSGLFAAVEQVLGPLCEKRGWALVTNKPSCVRIEINEESHLDLALYAISDSAYESLVEKALMAESALARDGARKNIVEDAELLDSFYRALSGDQIMLAHRTEGWKPSDPRKLEDWFNGAVEEHGHQLRRVCRYLKGWRDYKWDNNDCRLSSIALMAAVVSAFKYYPELKGQPNRDDKALLRVCEFLPGFISAGIPNPVLPTQRLDDNWSVDQRRDYLSAARDLASRVATAVFGTNSPTIALNELTIAFGDRIPTNPKLISDDTIAKVEIGAPVVGLNAGEQMRRAELAAQEVERRGVQSKPWLA